jgi:hypothetical protein
MKERLGMFFVSLDAIVNRKEEMCESLSIMKFLPIRVETLYDRKEIMYIGFSYLFDEKEEGSEATEYNIVVVKEDDKITEVKAVKPKNMKGFKI